MMLGFSLPMQLASICRFIFFWRGSCGRLFRMDSTEQVQIERRCGQRFPYQVSVVLREPGGSRSGTGFTQDLSSRGALIWTDFPLSEGQTIDMTFVMPSEITLAEDMSVCCRARVLRVQRTEGAKPAVAVKIEHYEFPHREVPALQQHTSKTLATTRV
jgi:hypothetical protein